MARRSLIWLPALRTVPLPPLLMALATCVSEDPGASQQGLRQTSFRVREAVEAPLDGRDGWAAAEGEAAVVAADAPFRIRFELEARDGTAGSTGDGESTAFRLQARRNSGPWVDLVARDFPYPDEISSPPVSIVGARGYQDGEATGDLLSASTLPFRAGAGVSLDSVTPAWGGGTAQGEWEWPLVLRRFADGAVTNDDGDTFEFRMRGAGGSPVPSPGGPARVRLTVPDGLLGGTFVETPGRLGPWQSSDGALHFIMEPAETFNVLMAVKSPDGGRSWVEVDGARRPATGDLEGVATAYHQGRIHILHQITDGVVHHVFRTSDTEGGEGWEIRDEDVATPGEPPVQVAALEVRPDGSAVAVYGGPQDLRVRTRSPAGRWGTEYRIEGPPGHRVSGPSTVLLPGGEVVLAYTTAPTGEGEGRTSVEGRLWVRVIGSDGIPGPAALGSRAIGPTEEESGALTPLVHLPGTRETVILFRRSDGHLWELRRREDGGLSDPIRVTTRTVVQNAVDSDQVGADAVAHDGVVHLLFIDEATRALHHTRRLASGAWTPDEVVVDGIDAQWVRGAVVRGTDGRPAYGFVYDAGSDGGSGMNRYGEIPLARDPG